MKKYLLFLFFLWIAPAFGQKGPFYQTADGEYAFQFQGDVCMLYRISKYSPEVYDERRLHHSGEYVKWSDSLGMLFSDGNYAISYDYRYFRVLKLKNGKAKDRLSYVAKRVEDPSKIYEAINSSYWQQQYKETISEAEAHFLLFDEYYYRGVNETWNSIEFKQAEPETFRILAFQKTEYLKDSLKRTNLKLIASNRAVQEQLDTLTIGRLKQHYLDRPLRVYAYNEYTSEMLDLVASQRPDLFVGLAEALPAEKEYLFDETVFSKTGKKSVRAYETDSPVKKEFFRYRRKVAFRMGLITTAAATLEVGVIGGVITGLVYLFRR